MLFVYVRCDSCSPACEALDPPDKAASVWLPTCCFWVTLIFAGPTSTQHMYTLRILIKGLLGVTCLVMDIIQLLKQSSVDATHGRTLHTVWMRPLQFPQRVLAACQSAIPG